MRVAMLQAALPPSTQAGGVGHQVDLLARALISRGHTVVAFVVDRVPPDTSYRCVKVDAPAGRIARVAGVGYAFAQLDLSDFDVVHAHGDDWLFGRRPRVRTFYGSALMEAKAATKPARKLAQACYYGFEWISSTNPHAVAISEGTRRYVPLVRRSIPCAVDPAAFYPGGERTPEPSILFVSGTMQGRKRGALLLAAFREVREAVPGARLTIVSMDRVDGPGITCLSNLPAADLGALYRSHWVLCSTSSYEGFGVPYVEALASGLPVVATTNEGAREVFRDGELGVLSSSDELAANLIAVLGDSDRRAGFSEMGVRAASAYLADEVARQYEELYAEVNLRTAL